MSVKAASRSIETLISTSPIMAPMSWPIASAAKSSRNSSTRFVKAIDTSVSSAGAKRTSAPGS